MKTLTHQISGTLALSLRTIYTDPIEFDSERMDLEIHYETGKFNPLLVGGRNPYLTIRKIALLHDAILESTSHPGFRLVLSQGTDIATLFSRTSFNWIKDNLPREKEGDAD